MKESNEGEGELVVEQIKSELAAASQSEISDFTLFAHFCPVDLESICKPPKISFAQLFGTH